MVTVALFEIDDTSGIPIWVQIRNRFAYLIDSGYYKPGDQLPTSRSLAAELSVNYHTCNKAYTALDYDGYISSRRGRGVFVIERENGGQGDTTYAAMIEECVRRCMDLGMSAEDVERTFQQVFEKVQRQKGSSNGPRNNE